MAARECAIYRHALDGATFVWVTPCVSDLSNASLRTQLAHKQREYFDCCRVMTPQWG